MANLKYSKQRASILEYLSGTHSHPTADMVYLHVKEEFPNISLGTVYRNLNLLADIGEITKIPTPDGGDRFDGRTDSHYHVICSGCGNVLTWNLVTPLISSLIRPPGNILTVSLNHTIYYFTENVQTAVVMRTKKV